MVSRTQALVLAFFLLAWIGLVAILLAAPSIYDTTLKLGPGRHRAPEVAFLVAISAFLTLLGTGVIRRWRSAFWLILVAFLAGALRVPVAILELTGTLSRGGPPWYVVFQAAIGVAQLAIGLTMLIDYRRAGIWGDRPSR